MRAWGGAWWMPCRLLNSILPASPVATTATPQARRRARRRPGRADRGLPARAPGAARDRVRGRGPGRRHRQDRGPRRLPLRPRRPPLLHQVQGGQRPLARGDERGVPQAPAHVADLLERQVPRLPAQGHGRDPQARPGRAVALRPVLPVGRRQAQGPRGELRAVGLQPLRQAALRALLQDLHREGLGRPDDRAARRVGRAADQGPVVLLRRQGRVLRQQGQQDQVADLRVPLPALRPGPDVGDDGRRDHRRRAARCGSTRRSTKLEVRDGRDRRDRGRRRADRARRGDLVAAAARDRRHGRRRRRRRRSRPPRRACATATS